MHLAGQYCWVYAIGALTLATVFAIEFTMPVWVALLAAAFLQRAAEPRPRSCSWCSASPESLIILRPGRWARSIPPRW